MLEQHFGLSKKEQQEVLDQFKRDLTEREGSFIHDEPIEEN